MSEHQTLALAAEFPATDRQDWHRLVQSALKDRPYETLIGKSYDGFAIDPLYERARGARPIAGRPAGRPWQVIQRVDHPDPAAANAQALDDLENGATGLALVFAGSAGAHGFGLESSGPALARALEGIHLDADIALELDMGDGEADTHVAALLAARGVDPSRCTIRFGYDPLGQAARSGDADGGIPVSFGERIASLRARGFEGPFAVADGRPAHAAGATEAQELAFALANSVSYLRALTDAGLSADEARNLIYFRLASDADEFLSLAKFRALRKLWARIEQASGLTPRPVFVSAVTAWRMMTARDAYVNMLRATLSVTAAGLGGADSITVLPFTLAHGLPDAFARRVARNLQLILLEESNLYRVADPAAGSGGIEALTTEIAQTAWTLFQKVEAAGGAAEALHAGLLQKKIAETRAAREAAIARRKDTITGVSDFPNLGELPVTVLDVRRGGRSKAADLPEFRLAEPYEALRDKSDALLARTGARPNVFLANLGKLSDFNARATFAKNFYEAGGIEAIGNEGFPDLDALIAAYKASGANLACLCSSDRVYAHEAERAAAALKAAGAAVHLAGRPGEHEVVWNRAGVTSYIYVGCDVLATLRAAHDLLVKP
jgi:methylmalonyl-CoA mutase